ncbi:MAG: methyltransferase [Gammaproteobacteria bacterium]
MKKLIAILLLACCVTAASADNHEGTEEKIRAAMQADIRGEADTERDRNRRPVETLLFFGLRDDMKVVELMPGGGWYTKILAPVLAENGEYYAALGTGRVKSQLSGEPGFEEMNFVAEDARIYRPEGERFYAIEADGLGVTGADMVLTFRNYHNFSAEGRAAMNRMVFDALKSGGIYGVVDHSRRHMEPDNPENGRRADPVLVIKEVEDAGFEFVDYSDLHYRPDDELRYEVGRATVTGNTDRFTLKFRKP